jgi:hypothetical protein
MVTDYQKTELRRLGISEDKIRDMTADEACKILARRHPILDSGGSEVFPEPEGQPDLSAGIQPGGGVGKLGSA